MAAQMPNIYQFKITLKRTKPKIWRRIQVLEDSTFRNLHVAIQHAMGWSSAEGNYHLHQFEMLNPETLKKDIIGIPESYSAYEDDFSFINEKKVKIAKYYSLTNKKANYEYDFGDGWQHEILLEKILPAVTNSMYPKCIAGRRACPPEDCGGVRGYEELLEIVADPNHEEHNERMEWLEMLGYSNPFKPEVFDPK
jgi:hypothetical protein